MMLTVVISFGYNGNQYDIVAYAELESSIGYKKCLFLNAFSGMGLGRNGSVRSHSRTSLI